MATDYRQVLTGKNMVQGDILAFLVRRDDTRDGRGYHNAFNLWKLENCL